MNVEIISNGEFLTCVFWFFSYGLLAWFMGWGVGFMTHLFIKIIGKE